MHLARRVNEHVDLAAHAELGLVDSGLDRETGAAENQPLLVGLEVVHVGPVAVDFLADVVAGAVDEVCAVAGVDDHLAAGVVHFPALQGPASGVGGTNARHRGVAGPGDNGEDALVGLGDGLAREPDPGQVAVNRAGLVELAPQIDQHEFTRPDHPVLAGNWLVVRADADDRWAVGRHSVALEVIHDRRLDLGLADRAAGADPLGDQAPGEVVGRGRAFLGLAVHLPLVVVPGRLELLDQVSGRGQVDAANANNLEGAGVHFRDIGICYPGCVFHRNPALRGHEPGNARFQLLPGQIDDLATG